jgi:hypothetical protein
MNGPRSLARILLFVHLTDIFAADTYSRIITVTENGRPIFLQLNSKIMNGTSRSTPLKNRANGKQRYALMNNRNLSVTANGTPGSSKLNTRIPYCNIKWNTTTCTTAQQPNIRSKWNTGISTSKQFIH